MSRGLTWSSEETRCLLDIWADVQISQMLEKTHKNAEVYKIFSKQMRERGFERSVEQCRVKVKKLRQNYIKVRDALSKTGSSGEEKDKCPWFDELDKILGTRPTVCPVDIVESSPADKTSSNASHSASPSSSNLSGDVELHGFGECTRY